MRGEEAKGRQKKNAQGMESGMKKGEEMKGEKERQKKEVDERTE